MRRILHTVRMHSRGREEKETLPHRPLLGSAILLVFLLLVPGCDTGLGPLNEPSGFSGVIRYTNWPSADSLRAIRLVAFESYPSDSSGILIALLTGKATVYPIIGQPNLPSYVDETAYVFTTTGTTLQIKEYDYVAVAVQYGPNILTDWWPVGVYTKEAGTFNPSPVRVLLHRITPGIDINVDFHNRPPRPWR